MTHPNPTVDATYCTFAEMLLRRHRLLVEGKTDFAEIEEIENDLSALWRTWTRSSGKARTGSAPT